MITVKEVFSKAFGEVPEGATCHLGYDVDYEGFNISPAVLNGNKILIGNSPCPGFPLGGWCDYGKRNGQGYYVNATPDISDRDATSFIGFFGDEYDNAFDQLDAKAVMDAMIESEAIPFA